MIPLQVIYEDNHLIAVNKPAGVLVQADQTGDPCLADYVRQYIKERYEKPGNVFLGTIHRLDRPVSGAILFARTSKGLARMNELFRKREIEKEYLALTRQRPAPLQGTLEHFISKDRAHNVARAYDKKSKKAQAAGAKPARLHYRMIGQLEGLVLLRIQLETGRPHQIRVQLASSGMPIYGDVKYGSEEALDDGSIGLHSYCLRFLHPVKNKPVRITAGLPRTPHWSLFSELVGQ